MEPTTDVKTNENARVVVTNTLTKDEFINRVTPVFKTLEERLSKSFGPYGSNTIICDYPYTSTTKDGWTIMKSILFADPLDRAIAQMVTDICGRLNNTVGDGTTTAIVATNALYNSCITGKFDIPEGTLPRDILSAFRECCDEIIKVLKEKYVRPIDISDEDFGQRIRNVVNVSSNGNAELTEMIGSIYDELKFPAIDIQLAADGITKKLVVDGYSSDISLMDKIYINNDNKTATYNSMDVVIFEHKVTSSIFKEILIPLNEQCRGRGRHLLVIAPFYDERALDSIIKDTLNAEYRRSRDVNMVLAVCSARNEKDRKCLSDLAMLFNTTPITNATAEELIRILSTEPAMIHSAFNIDFRNIPNIGIITSAGFAKSIGDERDAAMEAAKNADKELKFIVELGYCDYADIGLKSSTFRGFYYDENLYKLHCTEAEQELTDAIQKYKTLGTFNLETTWARQRLAALKLKMAMIEVGGESALSQGMMRDVVDDAVKAAASAYNNGTVLGCHVNLISAINELADAETDNLKTVIYCMIADAFCSVQHTLLKNKYGSNEQTMIDLMFKMNHSDDPAVFDIVTEKFTKDIITSADTDIQVLRATMDLISLLISGNQFVYRHIQGSEF